MNVDKIFLKSFLHTFKNESFCVKFWDGDEVKVGENEPLFKIILKKPIPKKDILTSTTLAFGEAYMNGDLEVEGDFLLMLNTVLKYKEKLDNLQKEFSTLGVQAVGMVEKTFEMDSGRIGTRKYNGGYEDIIGQSSERFERVVEEARKLLDCLDELVK